MSTKMHAARALALGAALTTYACGTTTAPETPDPGDPGGQPAAVATVEVTGPSTSLSALGESVQLAATPKDASGATVPGKSATWSTSAPTVASVSTTGLVTALDNGDATITAAVDGVEGTSTITVAQIATLLTFAAEPTSTEEGQTIAPAVEVTALDARNNLAETFNGDVTVSLAANPGGGALDGTTTVTASAGTARFADLAVDAAGSGYTLEASTAGLGSVTSSPFDVEPLAQAAVWTDVTAGGNHTCGIRTGGRAYCWGNGDHGRLGTGSGGPLRRALPVLGGLEFTELAAGDVHTCGITTSGAVYCWGRNQYGELGIDQGDGIFGQPVEVVGGLTFAAIEAGMLRGTCGISTDALLYCWGLNDFGQVGDGTRENRRVPSLVTGGLEWQSLARYVYHTCGVTTDGDAYCWGRNDHGQHGNGGFADSDAPALVGGGGGYGSIATGLNISCAVLTNGAAVCWGDNGVGQLGDGTTFDRLGPSTVQGGPFVEVDGGGGFTCGLGTDGSAYCWGDGTFGQLGNGQLNQRHSTPQLVIGGHEFASISVGGHACGLTTEGELFCWGFNESGQLGDGSTLNRASPVRVLDPTS